MRFGQLGVLIAAIAVSLSSCSSRLTDAPAADTLDNALAARDTSAASASELRRRFFDGTWALATDRALRAGSRVVDFPNTPLPESAFSSIVGGASYRLAVSESGGRVEIAEPRMVARLERSQAGQLIYNVVEGTFAGGRLSVWSTPIGLQAELTIFGSGVPVVKSERGPVLNVR